MAWLAPREGRPGRPPVFSDAALQVGLSIKGLLKLPLRQTAGMVAGLLRLAGLDWPVPDFSTLCRRQKTLAVQIPYRGADGPLNLLVPSRALRCKTLPVNGQHRDQGPRRRRMAGAHAWGAGPTPITARQAMQSVAERGRKVHLAMDPATSDIRAVDSPVLPDLLDQIPSDERVGTVTADGACDTRRCHAAIIERQAIPIIPIRKNGRPCKEDCPASRARNETLRATRHDGRAFWKRWTGYHARSRIEADPLMVCKQTTAGQWMRCLKAFGERIMARGPDRQTAEIHIRIALMNRFNDLGTAEIARVA